MGFLGLMQEPGVTGGGKGEAQAVCECVWRTDLQAAAERSAIGVPDSEENHATRRAVYQ